jgi:DNA-binding GntR family transcriptional regulator
MATGDLDDLSGVPRYLQIAQALETQIRSGELEPGKPAPSRNYLAETYGVARETAARAHYWLADRGYLVPVAGVGMVITPAIRWPAED